MKIGAGARPGGATTMMTVLLAVVTLIVTTGVATATATSSTSVGASAVLPGVASAVPNEAAGRQALIDALAAWGGQAWAQPEVVAFPQTITVGDTITNQPAPGFITTAAGQIGATGFAGDGGPATAALLSTASGVAFDVDGNLFVVDRGNRRIRRVDATTGTITTIAGGGSSASLGDGGPATAAFLNTPQGLAVGPDGDVYVTDIGNSRVRRVDTATGIITTVAGSGGISSGGGYTGDGGLATAATLRSPSGLAVADNGDLYIADTGNHAIRKVDAASGVITTVVGTGVSGFAGDGGPAGGASLASPTGVAVAPGGVIFIADRVNSRVRRIDPTTGVITTVAGTGTSGAIGDGWPSTAASLISPVDVAVDIDGDLYVAEGGRNRVRRIDAGTGTISTVIGTVTGDCGDGGPSIAACISGLESVAVAPNGLIAADSAGRAVFVTPGLPPDAVTAAATAFQAGGCCSPDLVRVSWTPPATPINGARVVLSPGAHITTVSTPVTSATFSGLLPGERYTATVETSNGWGFSAPFAAGSATFGPGVAFDRFDASVTGPDFVNAYLLAIASKLVYGDPDAPGTDATYVRAELEALGLRDVAFRDEVTTDTQYAIGRRGDTIVVTFRGTSALRDWFADVRLAPIPFSTDAGTAWAHTGFVMQLESVYDAVLADIAALRADHPGGTVVVAGHSLGGALAELAAARLRDDGVPVAGVHTFGAPNVGGAELDQLFDDMGLTAITHRWVNDHDAIPMALDVVPPYSDLGRTHVFERGVSAPTLDAADQPAGPFGLLDHDLAVYAENLLRQIGDTTLLPPPPTPLTDFVSTLDTETLLGWAAGPGSRTDVEIEAFLVESGVSYEEAIAILIALLDQLGYDRLVAILQGAFDPGALAIATSVRAGVGVVDLPALGRALLGEFGLDATGLIAVLEGAGFDPAIVAGVVASIFGQGAELLAEGLATLDSQLAQWGATFGLGGDAALLPTDLATLFGLADQLDAIALPALDPGAGISAAADALAAAGWTVDWVTGGTGALAPPTPDDVVQARTTYTVDGLASLADPIEPTATGLLDGIADALALQSSGTWDGALTVDLVVGVDAAGFYLHPDTTVTVQVGGTLDATDDGASIAGGPATVAATVTADVTAAGSPDTPDRIRPGATLPTPTVTLAGTVATTLLADLGDIQVDWGGTWDVALDPSGDAAASLRAGATLSGTALLAIVDPPATVDLTGTWLGDRWRLAGDLSGQPTVAGLTVTAGTLDAELAPGSFSGTATLDVEIPIAGSAPIVGQLGIDWSPTGTTLSGKVRLDGVVAGTLARFDGITLTFATTGAGTTITLDSDPPDPAVPGDSAGTIALFRQGTDQLLLLERPSGSFTPDGVLTLNAVRALGTIAGEIAIEADGVEVTLATPDPNDPQPLISFGDLTGTVPSLGDLTVTFTGLELMDDGTFRVTEVTADTAAVADTIGIAGLLPFRITQVTLVFPDTSKLDTFDATVIGTFDLTGLAETLPFTPILHIGDPASSPPPIGDNEEFTFTVRVDPSKPGVFEPVDLDPITIGFEDLDAGPLVLGGTLTLGGYSDGFLVPPTGLSTGQVAADLRGAWVGDGLTGDIEVQASGVLTIDTVSTLAVQLMVTANAAIDGSFAVDGLTLGADLAVSATANAFTLDVFELTQSSIGSIAVEIGDTARLVATDAAITTFAPTTDDVWISVGSAGFEITDPAFRGWRGSAAHFGLRVVPDASGDRTLVPVLLDDFAVDVAIGSAPSIPFPDWLPLSIDQVGVTFPDMTPGIELTPTQLDGMRLRLSASLNASDTFPITGEVNGLELDLGKLAVYAPPSGELPLTLDSAMFGVEPFPLGPITVGGGLGLGIVRVDADGDGAQDDPVWFARVFGEFEYSGFGAGVDLVLTEYGPVLAEVSAPTPIPLGTSGLMLSEIRGGIQFGGEGFTPPGSPIDLLDSEVYDLDFAIDTSRIATAVETCAAANFGLPIAEWPCFTWNDGGTVVIGTTITSYTSPGVVTADINAAVDLRFGPRGALPELRFAGTGDVEVLNLGIADAGVLIAFDDPLAPTLDLAMRMPGITGPVGMFMPATGEFTARIRTDGIAAGAIEGTRLLVESLADAAGAGADQLFSDALDELVVSLERARTMTGADGAPLTPDHPDTARLMSYRRLATALLDVNGDGVVSPVEQRTIDRDVVLDRLLGRNGNAPLLPGIDDGNAGDLAAIADRLLPLLRGLQAALIGEATRRVDEAPSLYELGAVLASPELTELSAGGVAFVQVMATAAVDGIGSGAVAWGDVFDPSVRITGKIQPVVAGVPFGEATDSGWFEIGRHRAGFGMSGSVEAMFLYPFGWLLGVSTIELYKLLGPNTLVETGGTLDIPDVFEAVADGEPMLLDPFSADWHVTMAITKKIGGFTLARSTGILIPPDLDDAALRGLVCRADAPAVAPCGGNLVPVNSAEHWDAIATYGGLLVTSDIDAPRFTTDPAGVLADLRLSPPDDWLGWLDLIGTNFAAVTAVDDVGSWRFFLPSLQRFIDPAYITGRQWPTGETNPERFGFIAVDALRDAAIEIGGVAYGEGVWDGRLLGFPVSSGFVTLDATGFALEATFPMFGDVPLTARFGGTSVTSRSTPRQVVELPVPGIDVALTGSDAIALLGGWGLPATIAIDPSTGARLRMYGPGYDTTSTDPLERDGGVELTATIDLPGLADDLAFAFEIMGTDPATAEIRGRASVASLGPFAGVTITDATVTLERVRGAWSLGIDGGATTPLGAATVTGTLNPDLTGQLDVALTSGALVLGGFTIDLAYSLTSTRDRSGVLGFTAALTGRIDIPALGIANATADIVTGPSGVERIDIGATTATFGPVVLSEATFRIGRSPAGFGPWRLQISGSAQVPGVVDALTIAGNLGSDGTGSLTVATGGVLRLGVPGATPVVTLTGATATLARTTSDVSMSTSGTLSVLGVPLVFGGSLTVGTTTTGTLTAATPAGGVAFGAATLNGTFSLTVGASAVISFAGTATVPGLSSGLAVSGTIASAGATTLTVSASSLTIDGYGLTDGKFKLIRTAAGATSFSIDAHLALLEQTVDVVTSLGVSPGGLCVNTACDISLNALQPWNLNGYSLQAGFALRFSAGDVSVSVSSTMSIPGIDGSFDVIGKLDTTATSGGILVGSLKLTGSADLRLGGSDSALVLMVGGSMDLARNVVGGSAVTSFTLKNTSLSWDGVSSFAFPSTTSITIRSDGSLDATASGRTFDVGQLHVTVPSATLSVSAQGASAQVTFGTGTIEIAGITPSTITLPEFTVDTSGGVAPVAFPGLASLGLGSYIANGPFDFERVDGAFRVRLSAQSTLGVPGLPSPIVLDSFTLGSDGVVATNITATKIGPDALSIRRASIAFTRTPAAGPQLTVSNGRLHLPVGDPIDLPPLTFGGNGTLTRSLSAALVFGSGMAVPAASNGTAWLELSAANGALKLRQTANRSFTLLGATSTLKNFEVTSSGTFAGKVTGSFKALGYTLSGGTFEVSKPAGWVDAKLTIRSTDPFTGSFGPFQGTVTGWVATNGRHQLSVDGTVSIPFPGGWLIGSVSLGLRNFGIVDATFSGKACVTVDPATNCVSLGSLSIDSDGDVALEVFGFTGTLNVLTWNNAGADTRPPTFRPLEDIFVNAGSAPTVVNYTLPAASDDRDDSVAVVCAQSSGSSFPAGATTVTCTATDDAGNKATRSFRVTVNVDPSTSSGGTFAPGATATAGSGGYMAMSTVTFTMFSSPIALGEARADRDGKVALSFTVPAVEPGRHHVQIAGVAPDGSALIAIVPIDVVASATNDTTTTVEPVGVLPRTGARPADLLTAAIGSLLAGFALLGARRRRPARIR